MTLQTSEEVLIEIRNLLKSREEKYDQYLSSAKNLRDEQMRSMRRGSWAYVFFGIIIVALGVYLGGLMLKLQGIHL